MNPVELDVLLLEDDEEICSDVIALLGEESESEVSFNVSSFSTVEEAFRSLKRSRYDIVILDVRLSEGESAERDLFEEIRRLRFVPVVFYTALPTTVRDLASPLVHVVEKTDGLGKLLTTVQGIVSGGLVNLHQL